MSVIQPSLDYAQNNKDAALEDLKAILRIASISTLPEHEGDISHAAEWLSGKLQDLGFDSVEIMPTAKHPIVYGEWLKAGPDAPTVLVYGHYDVQPVDPLDEWESQPFEPEIRGDNLYRYERSARRHPQSAGSHGSRLALAAEFEIHV